MTPREDKPDWNEVPQELRDKIAALIGEPIVRAETVWGGFGPSATFALTSADGRRYFCKGTHPGHTALGHKATIREREVYEWFPELSAFAPAYHGGADHEAWHMAVLDYAPSAQKVPPWTSEALDRTLALLARFHAAAPERAARDLRHLNETSLVQLEQSWRTLRDDDGARARFLDLFEDRTAAQSWLLRHIETFAELEARASSLGGPQSWIHVDIRSDNLVFAADGRVLLVDWPALSFGPVLIDVAGFLPSLAGEGGPSCAEGLRRYEQASGLRFSRDDVTVAVATIAGFFAARAGEPHVAQLPRLRWIQKLQLFPALDWLCVCMGIGLPPVARPLD